MAERTVVLTRQGLQETDWTVTRLHAIKHLELIFDYGKIVNMHVGTWIYTLINGDLVGKDEFGNKYYRGKGKKLHGRERRWVVYKGRVEASKVPPEWHAWLHHTVDEPLTEEAAKAMPWQQAHVPNLTGTKHAYRPAGHEYQGGKRAEATGDYEAWTPE